MKDPNRQAPEGVPIAPAAYAETKKLRNTTVIEHRGDEILETPTGCFTRNRKFADLEDAKLYLDRWESGRADATLGSQSVSTSMPAGSAQQRLELADATYQTHHGFRIYSEDDGAMVGDRKFHSLDGAQSYIDELRDLEQKMA